jgi:hypothetical protein
MQLGILFDTQKLGAGFYGYTAFRILFTIVPPRELAGCSLYHGEVGDGRNRPYCIAIESNDRALLMRLKNAAAQSMARGLMPLAERFAEDAMLREEVLALATRITPDGDIADCQSRWLQEAWLRAVGQTATGVLEPTKPHYPAPLPAVPGGTPGQAQSPSAPLATKPRTGSRPAGGKNYAEARVSLPQLAGRAPMALRWTPLGRNAFAWLLAFSVGGACVPWLGWPLSVSILTLCVPLIWGSSLRMRMWAEENLSSEDLHQEIIRNLRTMQASELCEQLNTEVAQASPLIRRLRVATQVWTTSGDLGGACQVVTQQVRGDQAGFQAEILYLRTLLWGTLAVPACMLAGIHLIFGATASAQEGPRLIFFSVFSWTLLSWMASLLSIAHERAEAHLDHMVAMSWIPAMTKAYPAPKTTAAGEHASEDLAMEIEQIYRRLHERHNEELARTVEGLRETIGQLTPVLAGFREPFVLQAVPVAGRQKAMSATA